MPDWDHDAVVYHLFPLGLCGAPRNNNPDTEPEERLNRIYGWIDHIRDLGFNTVLFGPIFEASTHGYDIADYFKIDRRLGSTVTFRLLAGELHRKGMRIVLDAVFNHTGRSFHGFRDILDNGNNSPYLDWFRGINFSRQSPLGDPFDYETWEGHYRFIKLNTSNEEVRNYIFSAVKFWIEEFDIDGLRLDCADSLDPDFLKTLAGFTDRIKNNFWLMGEVVHGDYSRWISAGGLNSVTNYNLYKALYSSHNDRNYFEIAYTLRKQFDRETGIYRNTCLYNFTDNHDVNRIASTLKNQAHLYPLHILLFTVPGIPSVYYGSEWGIEGVKKENDDDIRPELDPVTAQSASPNRDLAGVLKRLIKIRKENSMLSHGDYRELRVFHQQFAFSRVHHGECVVIAVNSSDSMSSIRITLPVRGLAAIDLLNNGEIFHPDRNNCIELHIYPCWGRILKIYK